MKILVAIVLAAALFLCCSVPLLAEVPDVPAEGKFQATEIKTSLGTCTLIRAWGGRAETEREQAENLAKLRTSSGFGRQARAPLQLHELMKMPGGRQLRGFPDPVRAVFVSGSRIYVVTGVNAYHYEPATEISDLAYVLKENSSRRGGVMYLRPIEGQEYYFAVIEPMGELTAFRGILAFSPTKQEWDEIPYLGGALLLGVPQWEEGKDGTVALRLTTLSGQVRGPARVAVMVGFDPANKQFTQVARTAQRR
ncbi:MAG: hypothetical protein WD200_00960 [Candidatus Andersenbacteria bacterium]